MSTLDPSIVDYICKKLQEGASEAAIMEEATDATDPFFASINGDMSIAVEYLERARAIQQRRTNLRRSRDIR
jgi:hypothetical protein